MTQTAAEFWNRQQADPRQVYWLFHPAVRAYANRRMTGVDWGWPQVWLKSQPDLAYRALRRGLSIGCGDGNFERSLRNLDVVSQVDAYDVAAVQIRRAKQLTKEQGVGGLHFRAADVEKLSLRAQRYDFAAFSHSLHHISEPDALLARVEQALKPGGNPLRRRLRRPFAPRVAGRTARGRRAAARARGVRAAARRNQAVASESAARHRRSI